MRPVVRILVTVVVWGLGALAALAFAAERSVGVIVWQLSQNHGIHLGDLVVAAFCTVVATAVTLVVWLPPYLRWRWQRGERPSRPHDPTPSDLAA